MAPSHVTLTSHSKVGKARVKMRPISQWLAIVMVRLTGHERQIVRPGIDFEWSYFWTHNIFRVYELIFGRKSGIKREMSSFLHDEKTIQVAHSWEAACALFEHSIREFFASGFKWRLIRVYVPSPAFAFAGMSHQKMDMPYVFAIARDAATDGGFAGGISTRAFNHTCTGSNLIVFGLLINDTNRVWSSASYNSVAMTQAGSDVDFGDDHACSMMYLVNPATGTHSLSMTVSGSCTMIQAAASYSGVAQSSPIDNTAQSTSTTDPLAVSVTVNTANSWIIAVVGFQQNTASVTAGANTSHLVNMDSGTRFSGWDTNSAQTTGSKTMNFDPDTAAGFVGALLVAFKAVVSDVSISVSDQLSITDAVTRLLQSFVSVSDQLNVSESVSRSTLLFINTSDQLTVTDTATVQGGTFNISVSDQLTLTDVASVLVPFLIINVSDQLTLTDVISVALAVDISVSDSVTISESTSETLVSNISVSDQLTVTDTASIANILNISVSDQLTVTDSATIRPSDKVAGLIILRGNDQNLPVTLTEQEYPLGMKDQAQM